jgi:hypothetical protein
MFGKFRMILPNIGKMQKAHGGWICQCSAKLPDFCQALAKSRSTV